MAYAPGGAKGQSKVSNVYSIWTKDLHESHLQPMQICSVYMVAFHRGLGTVACGGMRLVDWDSSKLKEFLQGFVHLEKVKPKFLKFVVFVIRVNLLHP